MYEYKCRILRVIDGDTVDIDIDLGFGVWMHRERVRLYGIDTPESRTRDLEEKKFGLLAKAYVRDHLPVGSIQTLVTIKDGKGKFGRILGQFKIGDEILNDVMIKEHHAVEYHGQSKEDIQEAHIKNRKYVLKENDEA
jgi:micrococcal nuclease|tara:strand:+ start:59393 stop:59806 length:414 start_codon:yes stop_codon:yes gene_type:complete